jgi:hypothetical protein
MALSIAIPMALADGGYFGSCSNFAEVTQDGARGLAADCKRQDGTENHSFLNVVHCYGNNNGVLGCQPGDVLIWLDIQAVTNMETDHRFGNALTSCDLFIYSEGGWITGNCTNNAGNPVYASANISKSPHYLTSKNIC